MTRIVFVLLIFIISGVSLATPDVARNDRFCRIDLGFAKESPEYRECQKTLEALYAEMDRIKDEEAKPPLAFNPVSVTKSDSVSPSIAWQLRITSNVDTVRIDNVVVNRGCEGQKPPSAQRILKFGEVISYGFYICDPIEVKIFTNLGVFTTTWPAFVQNDVSVAIQRYPAPEIVVTNHADSLIIRDVIVNRGNCKINNYLANMPMKFGQRYKVLFFCEPMEIQVKTDHGDPTFKP